MTSFMKRREYPGAMNELLLFPKKMNELLPLVRLKIQNLTLTRPKDFRSPYIHLLALRAALLPWLRAARAHQSRRTVCSAGVVMVGLP